MMTSRTQWLFCAGRSTERACVFEFLSDVSVWKLWSAVLEFARASQTELGHLGHVEFMHFSLV